MASNLKEKDYLYYEDMCDYNRWWNEANEIRKNKDWVELKMQQAPPKSEQMAVSGGLGSAGAFMSKAFMFDQQDRL